MKLLLSEQESEFPQVFQNLLKVRLAEKKKRKSPNLDLIPIALSIHLDSLVSPDLLLPDLIHLSIYLSIEIYRS